MSFDPNSVLMKGTQLRAVWVFDDDRNMGSVFPRRHADILLKVEASEPLTGEQLKHLAAVNQACQELLNAMRDRK